MVPRMPHRCSSCRETPTMQVSVLSVAAPCSRPCRSNVPRKWKCVLLAGAAPELHLIMPALSAAAAMSSLAVMSACFAFFQVTHSLTAGQSRPSQGYSSAGFNNYGPPFGKLQ